MQEPAETALGHGLISLLKHAPSSAAGAGTGYPTSHHRLSEGLPVTLPSCRPPPAIPACAAIQTLRARHSVIITGLFAGRDALVASQ
jgi:hypothetical protein